MKESIKIILVICIYRFLMDVVYDMQIAPLFSYIHLVNESTTTSTFTSWMLLFLLLPFVIWAFKEKCGTVSSYATMLFFLIRVIPLTSFIKYVPQELRFIILNVIFWVVLFCLLRSLKEVTVFKIDNNNDKYLMFVGAIAAIVVLIVSGVYAHFRIHLSLEDVYDLRAEAREFKMPIILKYLHTATANIIPILMVYYTINNKKSIVYLFAFIGILNFSIAGQKSTLFKILICFALVFMKHLDFKKMILPAFIIMCGVSMIEFVIHGTTFISTLVIRRTFYIPNLIDSAFYSYMSNSEPLYFNLFQSSSQEVTFAIGDELYGSDSVRANNGLFSDAFANLGSLGCVVLPVVIAYLLKMCESLFQNKDEGIILFTTLIIVTTLGSSFLTTSLMTHGLFFLCVTVALIPKKHKENLIIL